MTKSRRLTPWTDAERARLREAYADKPTKELSAELGRALSQVYQQAARLGLCKSDAYLASPAACRLRRGDNVGATHRFQKGQAPPNKGLRRPGWGPGRMKATQFKGGTRQGRAAEIYQHIGAERLSKDGILQRKVNNDMPFQRRWKAVHAMLWEEHHGPIPTGHVVVFADHDRTHITIENLQMVTRIDLMHRNSYHNRYPKEIGLAIQMRGALMRQINKRNFCEE